MTEIPKLSRKNVILIVAHPDDETLWAGGTILSHPSWRCFVICLCRGSDKDRAPKFVKALTALRAEGIMSDINDGPEQTPLDEKELDNLLKNLIPPKLFDLIITHDPFGEYTRHIRHEEVSKSVIRLWNAGKISANELWTFAYEDDNKEHDPLPIEKASIYRVLTKRIWQRKHSIITQIYGYETESFEARITPLAEAFWRFTDPVDAKKRIKESNNN
jgi:LmbE family N-acetylglucosaminyl deacetylase